VAYYLIEAIPLVMSGQQPCPSPLKWLDIYTLFLRSGVWRLKVVFEIIRGLSRRT
jgi:hypothetical protein